MTDNQTEPLKTSSSKSEKEGWVEKVLHLRAYLEQEQEVTKAICQNYEKAQTELSNMIEVGNQLCLDLKAQYLEKIEALNQEISHLQYQVNQEIEKLRKAIGMN